MRWEKETLERTQRLSTGFKGIWDRLTGRYAEIRRQNGNPEGHAARPDGKGCADFPASGRKTVPPSPADIGQAGTHETGRKSAPGCCRVQEDGWKRAARSKVTFPGNRFGAKPSGTGDLALPVFLFIWFSLLTASCDQDWIITFCNK